MSVFSEKIIRQGFFCMTPEAGLPVIQKFLLLYKFTYDSYGFLAIIQESISYLKDGKTTTTVNLIWPDLT